MSTVTPKFDEWVLGKSQTGEVDVLSDVWNADYTGKNGKAV